jgi:hypothetical protein
LTEGVVWVSCIISLSWSIEKLQSASCMSKNGNWRNM